MLQNFFQSQAGIKLSRLLMISGVVIATDQISKWVIIRSLPMFDAIPVIPGFFNITHIHNPGGAFGFMAAQGPTVRSLLFLVISSLAVTLLAFFYAKTPPSHTWLSVALLLIFGGAVGNMIDRFRFGEVVDFLDFFLGNHHWPAFNVADSAITIGTMILAYHLLFNKMPE
jgi:signal peptidase II